VAACSNLFAGDPFFVKYNMEPVEDIVELRSKKPNSKSGLVVAKTLKVESHISGAYV